MEDKIVCPRCHKRNDIYKFCVYCGHKLLDDEQIKLMEDNPEPYCLNCGRPVKKGQLNCECGYEFRNITCHVCSAKNSYTNRFCTTCGKKLWSSNICEINYSEIKFGGIIDSCPQELHNTIIHLRHKHGSIKFPKDVGKIGTDVQQLRLNQSRIQNHLDEIFSRWKIVSPNYCINCLSILKPDEFQCKNCRKSLDEKRVDYLKNKKYVRPVFDIAELKWNSKFSGYYLDSLSPDIGESQFEYRERLKWEYVENKSLKFDMGQEIVRKINEEDDKRRKEERSRQKAERRMLEEEYIRQCGGGYCSSNCKHYFEEIVTSRGASADYTDDMFGVYRSCRLGHSLSPGSFCKYYE